MVWRSLYLVWGSFGDGYGIFVPVADAGGCFCVWVLATSLVVSGW